MNSLHLISNKLELELELDINSSISFKKRAMNLELNEFKLNFTFYLLILFCSYVMNL